MAARPTPAARWLPGAAAGGCGRHRAPVRAPAGLTLRAALPGGPASPCDCSSSPIPAEQEVIERLAYGSSAGPGPGSCSGGRYGAPLSSPSCSSHAVMRSLLADLDRLGWGCLEELDQDAARLTLLHRDMRGWEHHLRLTLPPDYPASPPAAATDLPTPLEFRWLPQQAPLQQHAAQWRAGPAGGVGGGGGGAGEGAGVCSSIAHVFEEFKQLILRLQPLWAALEELDRRTRVLSPPAAWR
ncbi:hypothetical protein Agub_g966 [Astrephomene gubernaculifera]|uniref:FANCL UBC-like domain-containing protein n=1 Tax=Astrephomene gubernaculifera TaxID=47775 RepID=A0AAD3DEN0_9CHLO|nr:hypothetical protein Agub_g966 [Astrephomene gubernaculifera]